MKHRFLTALLLLGIFIGAKAQYSNTYESLDQGSNPVTAIAQTSLQSVIAHPHGSLTINKTQAGTPVLSFINIGGSLAWSVGYSDQSEQLALYSGALTIDGNFIVVGSYGKWGVAMKIDAATGTALWTQYYSPDNGTNYALVFSVITRSPDAKEMYIVAGETAPNNPSDPAGFYALNLLETNGQTIWANHYLDTSNQFPVRQRFVISHIAVNPHAGNAHHNGDVLLAGHMYLNNTDTRIFNVGISYVNGSIQKPFEELTWPNSGFTRHPHITFDPHGEYLLYFGLRQTIAALKTQHGLGNLDFGRYYLMSTQHYPAHILEGCTALPYGEGHRLSGWGIFLSEVVNGAIVNGGSFPFLLELDKQGLPSQEIYYYNKLDVQATLSSAISDFAEKNILFHGSTREEYTESSLDITSPEGKCPIAWKVDSYTYPFEFSEVDVKDLADHGQSKTIDFTATFYGAHIYDCSGQQLARPALTTAAAPVAGALAIAPNPTEGVLSLDGRAFAADQVLTIRDVTGKAVLVTRLAAGQQQTLEVAALPAGLYLITSADQQIAVRFVKK